MNILCYSSCYGGIFKDKIQSNKINNFDCIYWYERQRHTIDFNAYKLYDILICEYINERPNYYSSNEFITNILKVNPSIRIITYPLIVLNIFPFHKHAFGFLSCPSVDSLIVRPFNSSTIIHLYKRNNILFNPIDGLNKSLIKLKQIEQKCDIKVSRIIEDKIYKEQVCIDAIFPSNTIFNYLCEEIVRILKLDININNSNIVNDISNYHLGNSYYTDEMIAAFKVPGLSSHPNHKEFYYNKLIEYLNTTKNDL
jgi:hypothetical protein